MLNTFFSLVLLAFGVFVMLLTPVSLFRLMKAGTFARAKTSLTVQDIENDLVVWAVQNPESNFSHPDAQLIIRKCIKRMNELRHQNREIAEERIAKLIGLLN